MKFYTILILALFTSINLLAQLPSNIPTQNLIAWYSFNGNSADSSGNNNHMINNGATLTLDRHGIPNSAYSYDGLNDYMGITSPTFQMGETSSFTVSFWINKTNTDFGMPYWHGLTTGQGGTGKFVHFMQMSTAGNNTHWGTNNQGSAWVWAQSTYTVGAWEHWVCVYSNKSMTLYKDGIQVATNTYSYTGAATATMPFYLGTNVVNTSSFFNGKIDDFGIWQRALTATEVGNLFNPCVPVTGGTSTIAACNSYVSPSGITYTSTGIYSDTLQTNLGCDSIITLNLTINASSTGSETVSSCFEYTSASGLYTWTSSGIYTDTLQNAVGCDSIVTINLTINTVDTSITKLITTNGEEALFSNDSNATYKWLDCNANYAIVAGETSQYFSPNHNGNFAVELTYQNCVDTSFCYTITHVGIEEVNSSNDFAIYPNPNDGSFIINSSLPSDDVQMEIYSIDGRLIIKKELSSKEHYGATISLGDIEKGIYIIYLKSGDKVYSNRLIII